MIHSHERIPNLNHWQPGKETHSSCRERSQSMQEFSCIYKAIKLGSRFEVRDLLDETPEGNQSEMAGVKFFFPLTGSIGLLEAKRRYLHCGDEQRVSLVT